MGSSWFSDEVQRRKEELDKSNLTEEEKAEEISKQLFPDDDDE